MCSKRCFPGCAGRATSGKLTEDVDVPLSLYLTSFSATSIPMFSCASSVDPPTCGVKITLSRPRSGDSNRSLLLRGSTGNTSIAAPNSFLLRRASARASMSTTVPRDALIKTEPDFMAAIWAAPIIHWVAGVSGTCRLTTSDCANKSSSRATCLALPSGSLVTTSKNATCIPSASASTDSCVPMDP